MSLKERSPKVDVIPPVLKDLRNCSFKGQNLKGADFTNCDLRGVDFSEAELQGASFSGSTFGQTARQRAMLIAIYVAIYVAIIGNIAVAADKAFAAAFSVFGRGAFLAEILCTIVVIICLFFVFAWILFQVAIYAIKQAPGTWFNNANITDATFDNTILSYCDFTEATIDQVNWTGAVFHGCSFEPNPQIKLLIHRDGNGGSYGNLDFSDMHMVAIQFIKADLTNTNLSNANLQHADLLNAMLVNVKANGSNFSHATLTGACIYNWGINLKTQFKDVICDYIYLKLDDQGKKTDRRPSSGIFQPGEFAELVHKFTNTLDILFRNDINPTAFALALEPLQAHGNLELSGVENLPIGQLYRFKVPDDFPKEQAHEEFWQTYEDTQIKLKAAEDHILYLQETNQNLTTLSDADKSIIKAHEKHNNFLQELVFRQVDKFSRPTLNAYSSQFTGLDMSDKSTNPQFQAGGNINYVGTDGVAGENLQGVAGGDISGTLNVTIGELATSPDPKDQTLANHLKQLRAALESKESGLSDARKTKALELLTKLTKLAETPDKSSPDFLETATDTLEELDTIVKKGSGLVEFSEKHLPTIMTGIRFLFGLG
jgi:uncharacterized protein YjbI with pentapeptide repeats